MDCFEFADPARLPNACIPVCRFLCSSPTAPSLGPWQQGNYTSLPKCYRALWSCKQSTSVAGTYRPGCENRYMVHPTIPERWYLPYQIHLLWFPRGRKGILGWWLSPLSWKLGDAAYRKGARSAFDSWSSSLHQPLIVCGWISFANVGWSLFLPL